MKDDQDRHLEGNDVAPKVIPEAIEIGKVFVEISETVVAESVIFYVGNTVKTTVAAPSTGDTVADTVETDVTTSVGSNYVISAGNFGEVFVPSVYETSDNIVELSHINAGAIVVVCVENTLNDVETEMHIPKYTSQEKKKKSKKRMRKGGAKKNIDAAEIKGNSERMRD
ncbi:hypothetical protein LIER_23889 [Lithospermum erythrorhizon]|uniref:Uncharacterized protein n=1 Tax=Lithospermum erythrorhizon TaxID=34254 RepID=A0AAV3QZ09_LITER